MKKLFCLSVLCVTLTACSDPYGACAKAGADVATGIGQGFSIVGTLVQSGQIATTEANNVANYLEYANLADKDFLACVEAAHASHAKTDAFIACANKLNTDLNDPSKLAMIHIVNVKASQQVSEYVAGLVAGVKSLQIALGSK